MEDERLLERAGSGDEKAFALLNERHRQLVFSFAYRLLKSREIAEEVTHDCFLSLFKEPRSFKADGQRASLRTYLCANIWVMNLADYRGEADLLEAYRLLSKGNCCAFFVVNLGDDPNPSSSRK